MAKLSFEDKMRIQTLREQGWGAKRIKSAYSDKAWSLETIKTVIRRVDKTGSAVARKSGSGRPKSARTTENVARVEELICSQEGRPGTSKSTRQIAGEIGVSQSSVRRIAHTDLRLSSFKRVPVQIINEATKTKRLTRCQRLKRLLTNEKLKRTFFTDEKVFHLDPPFNRQNDRVWAASKKRSISTERLLKQRAKFSRRCMVSAGVCFNGKGRLHFVDETVKINSAFYIGTLLPKLIEDAESLIGANFIFQQDGAPAHGSRKTQEWIQRRNPAFIKKDEWPPNSPDLNPLDFFVWGVMLQKYEAVSPKPTSISELRTLLQRIWDSLPEQLVASAVLSVKKRLQLCIDQEGGHFQHLL